MKKVTMVCLAALCAFGAAVPALAAPVDKESTGSINLIKGTHPDGELRIEKLPGIKFGSEKLSGSNRDYKARYLDDSAKPEEAQNADGKYRPNYVQVVDDRGTNKGWSLQAKSDGFKIKGETTPLVGAVLTLNATDAKRVAVDPSSDVILDNQESVIPELATAWLLNSGVALSDKNATLATAKVDNGYGVTNVYMGTPSDTASTDGDQTTKNSSVMLHVPR